MSLYKGTKRVASGGINTTLTDDISSHSATFVDDGDTSSYSTYEEISDEITSGSMLLNIFATIKRGMNWLNTKIDTLITDVNNKYTQLNNNIISITDKIYPIGSIYMSVNSTNPSTLFGGTWVSWGSGKVPIGINESDTDFSTVEKIGGAKTINIAHSHTVNSHSHTYGIALSGYYGGTGFERDSATGVLANGTGSPSGWVSNGLSENIVNTGLGTGSTTTSTSHYKSTASTSSSSPSTNSQLSSTQSILQPYITCYMWKRTA